MKLCQNIVWVFLCWVLFITPCNAHADSKKRNKGVYLVLNNPSDSGMFAVFMSVLGALNYYENGDFAGLKIDLNSGRYLDSEVGSNWWEYFFKPISLGKKTKNKHYFSLDEYMKLVFYHCPKNRHRGYELIQKYVHLKSDIQKEVDAYFDAQFKDYFVIGVHHRGTDKVLEWSLISYEKTYNKLNEIINNLLESDRERLRIYIATDEQAFLTYVLDRFPANMIIYNDFARSTNGIALHADGSNFYPNNYQMGKEALLDCLFLSKCNILIRPPGSCLSHMSTFFNPYLTDIPLW